MRIVDFLSTLSFAFSPRERGAALTGPLSGYWRYRVGNYRLISMTDNKNRTVADIRHFFTKSGGNLGESNCVAWMFDQKGSIAVDKEGMSEEELIKLTLEAA